MLEFLNNFAEIDQEAVKALGMALAPYAGIGYFVNLGAKFLNKKFIAPRKDKNKVLGWLSWVLDQLGAHFPVKKKDVK